MLAADGLAVSISTLSRHLGAKRKGRERQKATKASERPAPSAAEMPVQTKAMPAKAEGKNVNGDARPVPPMPSPFTSMAEATRQPKGPAEGTVPRASSFPIRRDRERI